MLFRGGGQHSPVLVNEESASAAGANIDAEKLDNSLLLARDSSAPIGLSDVVDQLRGGALPAVGPLRA